MDITQIYAIAAGGIFFMFILANCLHYISQLIKHASFFTFKHLIYPYLLNRHRFFGPWTRASVLVQLTYMTLNVFCVTFQVSTVSQAGLRAGTLSLINMIPLFAGPHHSFLADLLCVSLNAYRSVHCSAGLMSFVLALFHVLASVSLASFSLAKGQYLFELLVSVVRSGSGTC